MQIQEAAARADQTDCRRSITETEAARSSSDGFILANSYYKPMFLNYAAADILSYPQKVDTRQREAFLANRIRALFRADEPEMGLAVTTTFRSGRRVYEGRAYRVNAVADGDSQISVAILLQRRAKPAGGISEISQKFNLTTREQQVVRHLTYGLTTKEVAAALEISPNTVKNFLHIIMVKMGVSTRSGIVGKALGTRP